MNDDAVMGLLRLLLKASGACGVPQGGVISPLLSNLYLNEADKMPERAREVTRHRGFTVIEYVRFADDLVVQVIAHPKQRWLHSAVEKRLREEFAKLEVEVNEQKSRRVDLKRAESCGFLGFDFWRVRSRAGRWMPLYRPQMKKRTALLGQLKVVFRGLQSQPVSRVISKTNPTNDGPAPPHKAAEIRAGNRGLRQTPGRVSRY